MEDPLDLLDNNDESKAPLHIGLKIMAFLIPISGLIMYFMYKEEQPAKAKQASVAAWLGFGLGIVMKIMEAVV